MLCPLTEDHAATLGKPSRSPEAPVMPFSRSKAGSFGSVVRYGVVSSAA
jgi:hypothetical protein